MFRIMDYFVDYAGWLWLKHSPASLFSKFVVAMYILFAGLIITLIVSVVL